MSGGAAPGQTDAGHGGNFLTERDVTKIALDYADYLVRTRVGTR
jgi:hypothetical protein